MRIWQRAQEKGQIPQNRATRHHRRRSRRCAHGMESWDEFCRHPRGLGEMFWPAEVREEMLPKGGHHPCHDVGFSPPGHPFSCCKRHWAWKALLAKLLLSLLSPKPGPGRAQKLGQDNPKHAVGQWPSTTQVVHQ